VSISFPADGTSKVPVNLTDDQGNADISLHLDRPKKASTTNMDKLAREGNYTIETCASGSVVG
jgi:hypothetical protein